MLRPFPPENANQSELAKYQLNSDALLKSVSSSVSSFSKIQSVAYNNPNLSNLTNLSQDILELAESSSGSAFESELAINRDIAQDDANNAASVSADINNINSGKAKPESILATIFKIVPIGVNIAKRGKTIATGFKETAKGIFELIKNAAVLSGIIWANTFEFNVQSFFYMFKLLLCSVKLITNCPKCVIFYFIQLYVFIIIMILISICFIFDGILMVKHLAGFGCVDLFLLFLKELEAFDKYIYSKFSYHLIHYPNSINNLCYNCDEIMGDTSGYKKAASRIFNNFFNDIPEYIGGPIGETITGIGHIFSFLDLR
jgi:hypothetical protein